MQALYVLILVGGLGVSLLGCDEKSPPTRETHKSAAAPNKVLKRTNEAVKHLEKPSAASSEPQTLLSDRSSAYAAKLLPRENELLVATPTHLFRLPDGETIEKIPAQLGDVQALHEDSIVFFRAGAIRALSLRDGKERPLVEVEHYVQYLLSSGQRLAWLSHERDGLYLIQTESAGSVKTLYTSKNQVIWPVLHDEIVYFLEQSGNSWRIGRAPLNGSEVMYGREHQGRVPSMLAAGPDGLYYYDDPKRGVRRLDFDLGSEEPIAEGTICSPLAVSSRVICAQVGGVIDIARQNAKPRTVATETSGPIADIAATDDEVYWIVDRGRERMAVHSAPLPDL